MKRVAQEYGEMRNYHVMENVVSIEFEKKKLELEIVTASIIRITENREKSYAIEGEKTIPCDFTITGADEKNHYLSLCTRNLKMYIHDDAKIDIYNAKGKLLCADYRHVKIDRNSSTYTNSTDSSSTDSSGTDRENPKECAGQSDEKMEKELAQKEGHEAVGEDDTHRITIMKKMSGDECFYGLGDKPGFLNKRGYLYENWNSDLPQAHNEAFRALYKSIPFFIVLQGAGCYGIFFDTPYHSWFDMGKESAEYYYFAADQGLLNYYYIAGNTIAEIIKNYTHLTGRTPLPQMWTLGYHQSRWSYKSSQEVMQVAAKMRACKIPCDAIHLDIDYMDGYRVFTWNKENFMHPQEMISQLHKKGFRVVTIVDPGVKVDPAYAVYQEGMEKNYFAKEENGNVYENQVWAGKSVFPDFASSEVRKWWAGLHKALTDEGVAGIWNDMNEPASFDGQLPLSVTFEEDGTRVKQERIHNVYGNLMSQASYEGVKELTKKRPFVLTRACYAGIQKYAAVWTGDNQSLWAHLAMAIPQLCSLGLSGVAFAGTDVGGFGADTTAELLIRWVQLGCFSPFFRNHCANAQRHQEPWAFGEPCLSVYRKYTTLRYQLLPYLYDAFVKCEKSGLPVMRPLVMGNEGDSQTYECNDEFMFGDSMLVAPVVVQGARRRMVYLPQGVWYDFWNYKKIEGGTWLIAEAPLDHCPVYVKENSVIPMYDPVEYVGQQEYNLLYMNVYGKAAEYAHYQDNGEDYRYRDGEFNEYFFQYGDGKTEVRMLHQGIDRRYERIIVKLNGNIVDIVDKSRDAESGLAK